MSHFSFIKKRFLLIAIVAMAYSSSNAQSFYQSYPGFGNYSANSLHETANGFIFNTKTGVGNNFEILELNNNGILQNNTAVNLPIEVTSHVPSKSDAIRISSGDFMQAYVLNAGANELKVFVLHHNSNGAIVHSFEVSFPSDAGLLVNPKLLEMSSGSVMVVSGYSPPNPIGPPGNKKLVFTEYNPSSKSIIQENTKHWDDFAIITSLLGVEESSDGKIFLNIWNENNENKHYVAKFEKNGTEIFRKNSSSLERPVRDMVATPDGGVWYWNDYFNAVSKLNADGSTAGSIDGYGLSNTFSNEVIITGIAPRSNGGVVYAAKVNLKLLLVRTSSAGTVESFDLYDQYPGTSTIYGGTTSDGGYYFIGRRGSTPGVAASPVFIKTNTQGKIEASTNNGADLRLSLTGSTPNPSIWSSHTITASVTNEGSVAVTGITVDITKADGVVYVGGNEYSATQGSFNLYSSPNIWQVGTVAAGATANITINYFKNSSQAFFQYAEIASHDGNDVDSSPGNGNGQTANEDDEAIFGGSAPGNPCEVDVVPPVITNCPTDITVVTAGTSAIVNWTAPQISDACSDAFFSHISKSPNSSFGLGDTEVKYIGKDDAGNFANCSFIVSVVIQAPPPPPSGGCDDNLLSDAGFENGFSANTWRNIDGGAEISADAYSGSKAMKIASPGDQRIIQTMSAVPGELYSLSAYGKTTDANKGGIIYLKFMTSAYQPIAKPSAQITSSAYQAVALDATAPANATFVEVGLQKANGSFALFADEWCLSFDGGTPPPPPGGNSPDLQITDLDGPSSASTNTLISFSFAIRNSAQVQQSGDFKIRSYFSTDAQLSSNDINDGVIVTGNLAAGQLINNVQGASNVPDLPAGNYYLILKIDADNVVAESNENNNTQAMPITISNGSTVGGSNDYCQVASDFPWHEWMTKVKINSMSWTSGKSTYSDFTNDAPIAVLERGANANYTFDVTYSYFTSKTYFSYYVDFNQNGIFEANEGGSVSKPAITAGTNVVSTKNASHAIPAFAMEGPTRARFIYSKSPITGPCDDIAFGEIEDYTVVIVDEQPNNRELFADENLFFVYPNPATTEVSVDISQLNNVTDISIYNSLGHLVQSNPITRQGLDTVVHLNTAELTNGTYVIRVSGENFKPRGEFIVIQQRY